MAQNFSDFFLEHPGWRFGHGQDAVRIGGFFKAVVMEIKRTSKLPVCIEIACVLMYEIRGIYYDFVDLVRNSRILKGT